jgi:hypothetical protein
MVEGFGLAGSTQSCTIRVLQPKRCLLLICFQKPFVPHPYVSHCYQNIILYVQQPLHNAGCCWLKVTYVWDVARCSHDVKEMSVSSVRNGNIESISAQRSLPHSPPTFPHSTEPRPYCDGWFRSWLRGLDLPAQRNHVQLGFCSQSVVCS